jgi:hypothetical protein
MVPGVARFANGSSVDPAPEEGRALALGEVGASVSPGRSR